MLSLITLAQRGHYWMDEMESGGGKGGGGSGFCGWLVFIVLVVIPVGAWILNQVAPPQEKMEQKDKTKPPAPPSL